MLHSISWSAYFTALGICLILYYSWWLYRYYSALPFSSAGPISPQKEDEPQPIPAQITEPTPEPNTAVPATEPIAAPAPIVEPEPEPNPTPDPHCTLTAVNPKPLILLIAVTAAITAKAQDGNTGINQANTMVRSYFDTGVPLMYAVGAILGLIGAVKVYQKWSHGDHDTGKVAASWFGACIFLVVVATLIRSFFGL